MLCNASISAATPEVYMVWNPYLYFEFTLFPGKDSGLGSGVSDMMLHSKLPRCWPEDLVGIPQGWKGVPASSIRMHFIQFKWDPFLSQLTLTNPASLFFLILRCLNLWLKENGSNPILTDLRGCSNSLIVLHIAYFGCLPKGSRAWKTSGSTDLGRQFNVICWL